VLLRNPLGGVIVERDPRLVEEARQPLGMQEAALIEKHEMRAPTRSVFLTAAMRSVSTEQ